MNQRLLNRDVRLRGDLQIYRWKSNLSSANTTVCVIHNPITGTTVRLDEADLCRLRQGKVSSDEALAVEARNHELLVGCTSHSATGRSATKWWRNPLYIRLPGIPADGIARLLARYSSIVFAGPIVSLWVLCFLITGLLLVQELPSLWSSLPALASFQAGHWKLALIILASTKVLHELAHAAVCRRMGAPCRQIGALLLCGMPCLYCDVSESWRIQSSTRRAAVMMAGIYIELIIATLAAWYWLASEPSQMRMLALHVMMVCGVSTIAFNINPLMRYDGYYVLSDLLNVTNLKARATEAWNRIIFFRVAGIRSQVIAGALTKETLVGKILLLVYHGLSSIYRYVVVAGLASWFYYVTARCGLEPVGRALVVVTISVVVVGWTRRWIKMLVGQGLWRSVSWGRRILFATLAVLLVSWVLFTPWQQRFNATGQVDYAAANSVYIPEDAEVTAVLADFGDFVHTGQPLVQLESDELRFQHPELLAQVRKLEHSLQSLKSRAAMEPQLLGQAKTTEAMLEAARRRLDRLQQQVESLMVKASTDGKVVRSVSSGKFSDRSPSSLTLKNLSEKSGEIAAKGWLWCRIANEDVKQVTLSINASQRAAIAVESTVRIALPTVSSFNAGGVVECVVADISAARVDTSVDSAVAENDRFEVTCTLPQHFAAQIPIGAQVNGVFKGKEITLAEILSDRLLGAVR